MEARGHGDDDMVSGCHLGFGSSGGGKAAAVGAGAWLETFSAPRPLDIQHMVMEAAGDQPIGLAIYTLF